MNAPWARRPKHLQCVSLLQRTQRSTACLLLALPSSQAAQQLLACTQLLHDYHEPATWQLLKRQQLGSQASIRPPLMHLLAVPACGRTPGQGCHHSAIIIVIIKEVSGKNASNTHASENLSTHPSTPHDGLTSAHHMITHPSTPHDNSPQHTT